MSQLSPLPQAPRINGSGVKRRDLVYWFGGDITASPGSPPLCALHPRAAGYPHVLLAATHIGLQILE